MAIFPVILCGGAGTRLWPASRPEKPKQFLDLTSHLSLFQETVQRVAPLANNGGRIVIVAGRDHRGFIDEQLNGTDAVVLLEPEGRDSAAAMVAAAEWISRQGPDGVAVFVASDHHIPDDVAFRQSVLQAVDSAMQGRIVVFGVHPTEPSSAYGYIHPQHGGLSPVVSFVEKPDRETASRYVAEGYLWNSGNLVVAADTLLSDVRQFEPAIAEAVAAALPAGLGDVVELGAAFRTSPRISIDYAVLERSQKVWVLPVGFRWSDLGAWDAVAATDMAGRGLWIGGNGDGANLVRAAEGMVVATAGVSDLAIIAEPDAVLVCHLSRSQEVKGLVERLREMSPGHLSPPALEPLSAAARRFEDWLRLAALPLWATLGAGSDGVFLEALDSLGRPVGDFRRARVQARQVYVYAAAGQSGWSGPWRRLCLEGLDAFEVRHRRDDGLYRTRVSNTGDILDDTPWVYDQAFVLFAFAEVAAADLDREIMSAKAHRLIQAMNRLRHPAGGWREAGDQPFQANAHMHLLEAFMAWEVLEPGGPWTALADEVVSLARSCFINADRGFIREFYRTDWTPAAGTDGTLIEPGHQFEWAWLLMRWSVSRDQAWAMSAATNLYDVGVRGVDVRRGVAVDALDDDFTVRSEAARLWPQTERLKAALLLAQLSEDVERDRFVKDARTALGALLRYLQPSGLWHDRLEADGQFRDEPAPASSLYHIMVAAEQLRALSPRFEVWGHQ